MTFEDFALLDRPTHVSALGWMLRLCFPARFCTIYIFAGRFFDILIPAMAESLGKFFRWQL